MSLFSLPTSVLERIFQEFLRPNMRSLLITNKQLRSWVFREFKFMREFWGPLVQYYRAHPHQNHPDYHSAKYYHPSCARSKNSKKGKGGKVVFDVDFKPTHVVLEQHLKTNHIIGTEKLKYLVEQIARLEKEEEKKEKEKKKKPTMWEFGSTEKISTLVLTNLDWFDVQRIFKTTHFPSLTSLEITILTNDTSDIAKKKNRSFLLFNKESDFPPPQLKKLVLCQSEHYWPSPYFFFVDQCFDVLSNYPILKFFQSLRELDLSAMMERAFEPGELSNMTQLQSLALWPRATSGDVMCIPKSVTSLVIAGVAEEDFIPSVCAHLHNLETLVQKETIVTIDFHNFVLLEHLRELHLETWNWGRVSNLDKYLPYCIRLETLSIHIRNSMRLLETMEFRHVFFESPSLTKLSLIGMHMYHPEREKFCFQNMPKLRTINLNFTHCFEFEHLLMPTQLESFRCSLHPVEGFYPPFRTNLQLYIFPKQTKKLTLMMHVPDIKVFDFLTNGQPAFCESVKDLTFECPKLLTHDRSCFAEFFYFPFLRHLSLANVTDITLVKDIVNMKQNNSLPLLQSLCVWFPDKRTHRVISRSPPPNWLRDACQLLISLFLDRTELQTLKLFSPFLKNSLFLKEDLHIAHGLVLPLQNTANNTGNDDDPKNKTTTKEEKEQEKGQKRMMKTRYFVIVNDDECTFQKE